MKLFPKDLEMKLQGQHRHGQNLTDQYAWAHIYDPFGCTKLWLINQDPENHDHILCISKSKTGGVEVGYFSKFAIIDHSTKVMNQDVPLERSKHYVATSALLIKKMLMDGDL